MAILDATAKKQNFNKQMQEQTVVNILTNIQWSLLSVTCAGANLALSIAFMLIGNTPAFLKPDCIFVTVMLSWKEGQNTSKKDFFDSTYC